MQVPGMRGLRVRDLAKRALVDFLKDDMPTFAAALAYHLFLALFPFILFLLALLGFLDLTSLFDAMLAQARQALPSEAMEQVEGIVQDISGERSSGFLSFGILGSIWIASTGMRAVMTGLNKAYDVEEDRPFMKRYGISVLYTLAFTALVVIATALWVVGPQIAAWAADLLGLEYVVVQVWRWLRFPVALVFAMAAVSLVYYYAPNLEQRFQFATVGSVVAVLLWAIASAGFQIYVTNFGRYSVTYGSIGAIIVLLLYIFLSGMILLFGGELNAELERSAPRHGDARPAHHTEG